MRAAKIGVVGLLMVAASPSPLPATSVANLRVSVEGLRDQKGHLLFCLTRHTLEYLSCDKDPNAIHASISANNAAIDFANMAPGEWALLMIHDSNANGKLDKRFGIPREGFGFSGNPPIRFGPPSAGDVQFAVPAGTSEQRLKMRYIF